MVLMPAQKFSDSYPKPAEAGGRLIRQVVGFLRKQGFELPFTSHILIAVSGGPDSIALAHLLLKYGRRVVDPKKVILLHMNHAWRETSDGDERGVREFAEKWKVPLKTRKLKPPAKNKSYKGRSWEEAAREARKSFFQEMAARYDAPVLTAHQADDLAETLLWRLFTGSASTHGGGIAVRHGVEIRPLLTQRKSELLAYLKEEGQSFHLDETNEDVRFLRARMRTEILPAIEKTFPRAIEHLIHLGLDAQAESDHLIAGTETTMEAAKLLFGASGIRARRSHLEAIKANAGEMHLPGGWKLTLKKRRGSASQQAHGQIHEQWLLERFFEPVSRGNGKEKEIS